MGWFWLVCNVILLPFCPFLFLFCVIMFHLACDTCVLVYYHDQ